VSEALRSIKPQVRGCFSALVAQRIEHLTTDQKVGGSNPSERAEKSAGRSVAIVAAARAALEAKPAAPGRQRALFSAEQDLMLVRLAADSGARRGELAVLRHGDLEGRVLTIERGLSQGVLGSTKSSRTRYLTLGRTTAALIHDHFCTWEARLGHPPPGDWLFAPDPARNSYLSAGCLSHRFSRLGAAAGVAKPALHRLRHGVATHLVDQGKVLKAQARLGHADPSTTLRHYSHCGPLHDEDVADYLDRLLNGDGDIE